MKFLFLLLCCLSVFAQNQSERKEKVKASTLSDLQAAEAKRLEEKQQLLTREQNILSLLQEIETNKLLIEKKEESILEQLRNAQEEEEKEEGEPKVQLPPELINHYQSRDPAVAAKDFMALYLKSPKVAISLIRFMKKKKSAKLMDAVVKMDAKDGTRVASEITAAIGEGD